MRMLLMAVMGLGLTLGVTGCEEDKPTPAKPPATPDKPATDKIEDGAKELGDGLEDKAKDVGEDIKEGAKEAGEKIKEAEDAGADHVGGTGATAASRVADVLRDRFDQGVGGDDGNESTRCDGAKPRNR